jgi:hypothetical protein
MPHLVQTLLQKQLNALLTEMAAELDPARLNGWDG